MCFGIRISRSSHLGTLQIFPSDQISQRSQVSWVTRCHSMACHMFQNQKVGQGVSEWVSQWHGHLLSCPQTLVWTAKKHVFWRSSICNHWRSAAIASPITYPCQWVREWEFQILKLAIELASLLNLHSVHAIWPNVPTTSHVPKRPCYTLTSIIKSAVRGGSTPMMDFSGYWNFWNHPLK